MPHRSFQKVFEDNTAVTIDRVSSILRPEAKAISNEFYTHMLGSSDSKLFLEHGDVEKRLSKSFEKWAFDLFCLHDEFDIKQLEDYHRLIGRVHARIGIPMRLVDYGMQIVKDYCFRKYLETCKDVEEIPSAIIYINNLLDTALTAVNQSYFEKTVDNERHAQLLRLRMTSADLNVECERVKSELLVWSRDILSNILSRRFKTYATLSNVYNTNFGLWVNHKAIFYFSDFDELNKIKDSLAKLDEVCIRGTNLLGSSDHDGIVDFTNDFNMVINEISWLLEQIVERNEKENQSKDPLTNMLSRRYIDNILKREVEVSMKEGQAFGILMIDLDYFKQINDQYGHATGDDVLRSVAKIILQCIRPTDFCFRYGGEEILVVLTHMNANSTYQKAEHIRRTIENHAFLDKSKRQIPVTASIGVAMHDGHPDYQKTVEAADASLYKAKEGGRNKVQAS